MPTGRREVGPLGKAVADALQLAREEAGLSLRVLAPRTDISFTQLGRILSGDKVMTLDEYMAICLALDLDPLDVMRDATAGAKIEGESASSAAPLRLGEPKLPPLTLAAARRVAAEDRPEWRAIQALDGVGEESQVDPHAEG